MNALKDIAPASVKLKRLNASPPSRWTVDGLASLNDTGKTFAEIADIIEANPEEYFTEPK